jgi:hypothetical protein
MKATSKIAVLALIFFTFPLLASASTIGKPANNLGLVGYWPLNEGTSTIASDASGNGNTMRLQNPQNISAWTSGIRGGAVNFDTTDYFTASSTPSLNITDAITISAWIYALDWSSNRRIVQKGLNDNQYRLTAEGGILKFELLQVTFGSIATALPSTSQWHHVVGTYDGGTIAIYIDGALANSTGATGSMFTSTDDVFIGTKSGSTAGDFFDGKIDDVRIYNRGLSATEVAALYKSGAARTGASSASLQNGSSLQSGLAGLWTMDGSSLNWTSGTAADSSGNGNTGQMSGLTKTSSPVAGKLGQAMKFTGTEYIDAGNNLSVQVQGNITMAAWTKPTTLPGPGILSYVIGKGYDGTNEGYYLRYHTAFASPLIECGAYNGGDSFVQLTVPFAANTMHHLACTYDGSNWNLYIDGVLANSNPGTFGGLASSFNTYIGATNISGNGISRFFIGTLDDVRLYSRALSASEIKQLFNLGSTTYNASSMQLTNGSSLQSGLVGLWTFDGPRINWTTGAVTDSSGQGNTGHVINMSTSSSPVAGKMGQALKFDGATSYINIGANASLRPATQLTVSAWIKSTHAIGSVYERIVDQRFNQGWVLSLAGATGANATTVGAPMIALGTDGTGANALLLGGTTNIANDNKWHLVTGTFSSGATAIYLDGQLQNSATASFSTVLYNSDPVTIGRDSTSASNTEYFGGSIDDVRIYNRALSASEIKQLYNLGH